jgi:hypothetical protein
MATKMKPDPVLSAIENWRAASALHHETFSARDGWSKAAAKEALRGYYSAALRMAKTRPTTRKGACALLNIVARDIRHGEAEWHAPAVATVAKFMGREAPKPKPRK